MGHNTDTFHSTPPLPSPFLFVTTETKKKLNALKQEINDKENGKR